MVAVHREREVITEFIQLYRDFPCLWDLTSKSYKDAKQKTLAWNILTEKLKEFDREANVASTKKKIENLKSVYKREVKKVKTTRASSAANDVDMPKLWYYKLMSFLDEKDDQHQSETDDDESLILRCSKRKRRKESIIQKDERTLTYTAQQPVEKNQKQVNSFGLYVGEQLEQVSTYQRQVAEKLIAEVIFLAKTNNLNFDSKVETPLKTCAFYPTSSHSALDVQPINSHDPLQIIPIPSSPTYELSSSPSRFTQSSMARVYISTQPSNLHTSEEITQNNINKTMINSQIPAGSTLKALLLLKKTE